VVPNVIPIIIGAVVCVVLVEKFGRKDMIGMAVLVVSARQCVKKAMIGFTPPTMKKNFIIVVFVKNIIVRIFPINVLIIDVKTLATAF
jgi:hypothetical protein